MLSAKNKPQTSLGISTDQITPIAGNTATHDLRGNVLEHYRYTAFGEVTIYNDNGQLLNQSAIDNTILWNTRRKDEVSGYYMYKYRHYAPELGRWPSRDPIEEDGGINLYAFVGNAPLNYFDLLGLADINVSIVREYKKWETIGEFTATASDEKAAKCCGCVSGQTLELKKGKYDIGKGLGKKNYPIWEGGRSATYSKLSTTSINGQVTGYNKRYPKLPPRPYPVLPGNIGSHNINIGSAKGGRGGPDRFTGTRMHHGSICQSSEGCPIAGSGMKKANISNYRYSELAKAKYYKKGNLVSPAETFPGHYFPSGNSTAKVIELNSFVECVKKHIRKTPSIRVKISSK